MSFWNKNWKNKKTGNIITISTVSYGSSETEVTFFDGEGVKLSMKESKFFNEYESQVNDYQEIKEQIAELCNLDSDFAKLGNIVLKRRDPDYFKVGAIVYLDYYSGFFVKNDDYRYYVGPEHPYQIVKMDKDLDRECTTPIIWVYLAKAGKKSDGWDCDYRIPLYVTMPNMKDAYWVLNRYDKPY